jgi:hypothetical protein
MDIQLVEALCGFQKPISTLDNRTIVITSHPGMMTRWTCFPALHFPCLLITMKYYIGIEGNVLLSFHGYISLELRWNLLVTSWKSHKWRKQGCWTKTQRLSVSLFFFAYTNETIPKNLASMSLGQIVKHGDIKCVLNEGMPIYRRPYEKGRLIIEFKVSCNFSRTFENG